METKEELISQPKETSTEPSPKETPELSRKETVTTEPQPKVKNPKKVEAGKKGALVKKLKKEQLQRSQQREKEIERVTLSSTTLPGNNEKSEQSKKEIPPAIVIRHGNVIDYGLSGLLIICVGYIGYRKFRSINKDTSNVKNPESTQVNLDMK